MIAVSQLHGRRLEAPDGKVVGRLLDVLFEEGTWRVRWLLVRPRGTRGAADVLLVPARVAGPAGRGGALKTLVALAACPSAETDLPVSRRRSRWPADPARDRDPCRSPDPGGPLRGPHQGPLQGPLQSGREIAGYAALAGSDALGRVRDLIVDEATWAISAVVIGPGPFRRGRSVPACALRAIHWEDGTVRLGVGEALGEWDEAREPDPSRRVVPSATAL